MVLFKSLIVLDLETTSLPSLDNNTTKVTELACIGCEIEHLRNSEELPRVLHKLVLLFNPYKSVHPTTSEITGLTNELLMNVKPFRKEDVEILREFINRLPSPVCLVAQNGDAFDFPILRRAMVKVNKELQNNVYCVDSLKAFRALLSQADSPKRAIPSQKRMTPLESPIPLKKTNPVNSLQYKTSSRELFPNGKAHPSRELFPEDKALSSQELFPEDKALSSQELFSEDKALSSQELFPEDKALSSQELFPEDKALSSQELFSEDKALSSQELFPEDKALSSQELFPEDKALIEWLSRQKDDNCGAQSHRSTKKLCSFKLKDVYKFYFGGRILAAHTAEGDAKALLRCIMRCQGFLEWMNENAIIFNSIDYLF